jgi:hypothetical protein
MQMVFEPYNRVGVFDEFDNIDRLLLARWK